MPYKEALSPAEEKFERWRKTLGLFLGPALFLVFYFLPIEGLKEPAQKLVAVLAFVLVFWLTEAVPIPVTALMGAVLCVLLNVAPAKEVLAPFANPLIFLFIGSFMLAESIMAHGLDKRFAFAIFSIRFLQRSPLGVLFALGSIAAAVSMWISNTAATAMMFPIALGVLGAMRELGGDSAFDLKRFSTAMMLIVAYGASVGGIATPIGTPPNLIGIGMIDQLTGTKISFFSWMVFAVPLTAVMFVLLFLILSNGSRLRGVKLKGIEDHILEARMKLGPWKTGEVNTAIAFGIAVLLWMLPSALELAFGKDFYATKLAAERLNEGIVAVIAASVLFLLPVSFKDREFTLSWERAVRIDWGTILLFGGGLSLGGLMFSTGLADYMGRTVTGLTGADSLLAITAIGTALAIVLSETTSNTASANMVIPVVIAVAEGAGVSPIPPALGACLGASFGFMLPVSTPPNAIVYGSGLVPILSMVRKGIIFDIIGFFLIVGWVMVLSGLMGWA